MNQEEREIVLNSSMIPEAKATVIDIQEWLDQDPKRAITQYGHGLGNFAWIAGVNRETDQELQKQILRRKALELIKDFGDQIIEFMKPELREALGLDEKQE